MKGAPLVSCGHYVRGSQELGGHCQYSGCGREACRQCLRVCMGRNCQRNLCGKHQVIVEDRTRVYCPDCVRGYYMRKVLKMLFGKGVR